MTDYRDAREVRDDEPPPATVRACDEPRPRIRLRINGHWHRAIASHHHTWPDGRTAHRLILWPGLPDGRRFGIYWDDGALIELPAGRIM